MRAMKWGITIAGIITLFVALGLVSAQKFSTIRGDLFIFRNIKAFTTFKLFVMSGANRRFRVTTTPH
jgi:hypothetical protein